LNRLQSPPMQILKLHNTTAYRGRTRVFDGVNLTVEAGCSTAIVGPNGAGKSTLMKILAREIYPVDRSVNRQLESAVDGSDSFVEIMGQRQWNVWELRNQLGVVSAELQQNYHRHVLARTVVLSGFFSSVGHYDHQSVTPEQQDAVTRVLAELGIAELQDRPFATLSTGEQRRCLLGRALVNQPRALVFDEPTSGLDLAAMFQYLDTMRKLIRGGTTVVLVTHHIHEIPPEIERVVLLKKGRVFRDGEKEAVLTSENLSELFDVSIAVVKQRGFYQAFPA
jgi:iron complex transport system ATP-binding protein